MPLMPLSTPILPLRLPLLWGVFQWPIWACLSICFKFSSDVPSSFAPMWRHLPRLAIFWMPPFLHLTFDFDVKTQFGKRRLRPTHLLSVICPLYFSYKITYASMPFARPSMLWLRFESFHRVVAFPLTPCIGAHLHSSHFNLHLAALYSSRCLQNAR